jgi:hypothetical protein
MLIGAEGSFPMSNVVAFRTSDRKSDAAELWSQALFAERNYRVPSEPTLEIIERFVTLREIAIWRITRTISLLEKRHSKIRAGLTLIDNPTAKGGLEAQLQNIEQQLAAIKRKVDELRRFPELPCIPEAASPASI